MHCISQILSEVGSAALPMNTRRESNEKRTDSFILQTKNLVQSSYLIVSYQHVSFNFSHKIHCLKKFKALFCMFEIDMFSLQVFSLLTLIVVVEGKIRGISPERLLQEITGLFIH